MRKFWEKKREIEGEERGTRQERENEIFGLEPPFYVFLADLGTLERREPHSSMFGFYILPFTALGAC